MTDIYVRKPPSEKGKWIAIGIGGVGLIVLIAFLFSGSQPGPDVDTEELPASTTGETSAETDRESAAPPPPTPSVPAATDTAGSADAAQLLTRARSLQADGDLSAARQAALQIMNSTSDERMLNSARTLLSEINTVLAFSPRQMDEKVDYTIQPGDTLAKIASEFGTTIELLQKSNNLRGSLIRVGDRLRILKGQFSVEVDKSDNLLDVYLNDRFFKRYRVGTGEYAKTPEGEFIIDDRIAQPTWWRPDGKAIPYGDPENLLGTHWLSLNIRGYGIHGTWEPDTIGQQASAGCVRLLNDDIEELYALLPHGTPVRIQN